MTTILHPRSLGSQIAAAVSGFGQGVAQIAIAFTTFPNAVRAMHDYESLSRLSDAGLAKRGLARGDLAQHVITRHFPGV